MFNGSEMLKTGKEISQLISIILGSWHLFFVGRVAVNGLLNGEVVHARFLRNYDLNHCCPEQNDPIAFSVKSMHDTFTNEKLHWKFHLPLRQYPVFCLGVMIPRQLTVCC